MKKTLLLVAVLAILLAGAFIIYNATQKSMDQLEKRDKIDLDNKKENVAIKPSSDKETAIPEQSAPLSPGNSDNTDKQDSEKGDYENFYVYDNEDNKIYLSSLVNTGKPVIINYWTTWCGYCKMEMPDFNEAYHQYKDKVEFMMINICGGGNDNIDSAKAYIEEEGYDFPVYYDSDLNALSTYYTDGFPTTIVIDSNGNVVYAKSGALSKAGLESIIDQII